MEPVYYKKKYLLQIYVLDFHNGLILPVDPGLLNGTWSEQSRFYIGDRSLLKYTPKQIYLIRNRKILHVDVKNS